MGQQLELTEEDPKWLKVPDAAKRLGCSNATVRRWLVRKLIKGYRVQGTRVWLLKEEDVENAIKCNLEA